MWVRFLLAGPSFVYVCTRIPYVISESPKTLVNVPDACSKSERRRSKTQRTTWTLCDDKQIHFNGVVSVMAARLSVKQSGRVRFPTSPQTKEIMMWIQNVALGDIPKRHHIDA